MSSITTQILDASCGKPGTGVHVVLERKTHTVGWQTVGEGITDMVGRLDDLLDPREAFLTGHYRLTLETGPYFLLQNIECFFPQVTINFVVKDAAQNYHVPLIISPYGYSTHRGS